MQIWLKDKILAATPVMVILSVYFPSRCRRGECNGNGIDGTHLDAIITSRAFVPVGRAQSVLTRLFRIVFPAFLHVNGAYRKNRLSADLKTFLAIKGRLTFFMIDFNCRKSWGCHFTIPPLDRAGFLSRAIRLRLWGIPFHTTRSRSI